MAKKKNKDITPKDELDKKINDIIAEKRDLMIKEDRHEITSKEYDKKMPLLEEEWRRLNRLKIQILQQELAEREKKDIERKEETVKKEKLEKKKRITHSNVGRKPTNDSYSSLIIKALQHPKIDSEAKAVAVVLEWKPGTHKENIKKQIHNIIALIKNKKERRYSDYEWEDEKYMVIKSCQTKL